MFSKTAKYFPVIAGTLALVALPTTVVNDAAVEKVALGFQNR